MQGAPGLVTDHLQPTIAADLWATTTKAPPAVGQTLGVGAAPIEGSHRPLASSSSLGNRLH